MEMECKIEGEEVKETQKGSAGKRLRERALDKVSSMSVAGMAMTPLCEESVKDVDTHGGLEPNLQPWTLMTDPRVDFSFCMHDFSI